MISRLPKFPISSQSFFLFGPRQCGKSTLIREALKDKEYIVIDLLHSETLLKYRTAPQLLRKEVGYLLREQQTITVFIDEIQKAPILLNEIHAIIEEHKDRVFFILTGSSARKLKRSSVNMLAGRAWEYFLFPLTHRELGDLFILENALLKGTLPPVISQSTADSFRTLRAYTRSYLKEEILDEALTRNLPAFSRFLDLAADQSGGIVNYATMARDIGVSGKTILGYYQILEDTLIALKLEPFLRSARKRLVRHPRYYLFDLGVLNSLAGRTSEEAIAPPSVFGVLFEHFVILEASRLLAYTEKPARLHYWRSSHGAEVDLVVELSSTLFAIEIKSSPHVHSRDLRGLRSFLTDYPQARPVCVSTADRPYLAGEVPVIPWRMLFGTDYLNC